ncbi:hypothetical protein DYI37_08560 [Fulvimarina endophytica]|uniref:Uncharacterized protein n=1 Tax=Fulvimarina endophytica TaxID=2293836 RepID=A0A371X556_9HYPH|nr:hypothetical protein DYI37_08560 [Fulvimarina endophytica]
MRVLSRRPGSPCLGLMSWNGPLGRRAFVRLGPARRSRSPLRVASTLLARAETDQARAPAPIIGRKVRSSIERMIII